jgi:simple sugar transport system substrate-binding protein
MYDRLRRRARAAILPAVLVRWVICCLAALALLAGCGGGSSQVREGDIDAAQSQESMDDTVRSRGDQSGAGGQVRLAVVTHGEASSVFWSIVRNGISAAARETGAAVNYRSPDTYSLERMVHLIDAAVARQPDGLIVTIPDAGLDDAIRRARDAGIPVVSINSGLEESRKLKLLAHVGQPEFRAGYEAGQRLARAGARNAICINQEASNVSLNERCRAFAQAMRRAGGRARMVRVSFKESQNEGRRQVADAVEKRGVDGALTLSSASAEAVAEAVASGERERPFAAGTFDLSPAVLDAVQAGDLNFAIDQQPYLQGYLPVVLLDQLARNGVFPSDPDLINTGPTFITRRNAARVAQLSEAGIH